jgi:hypothetical protein
MSVKEFLDRSQVSPCPYRHTDETTAEICYQLALQGCSVDEAHDGAIEIVQTAKAQGEEWAVS